MTKFFAKAALAATVATGLFAAPALAANNSDNKDFTATATIMKPIVLTKGSDLDFGQIVMGPALTTQTVKIGQNNSKSCGGTDLGCTFLAQSAASFTLAGVGGQILTVDLGVPPTTLDDAFGNSVDFRVDAPATVTLASDGTGSFGIGGEIDVLAGTADGVYDADLNVTVTYQ